MAEVKGMPWLRPRLLVDGQEVVPAPTGFVGRIIPGQIVRIVADVLPDPGQIVLPLDVDGQKNVQVQRECSTSIQIKWSDRPDRPVVAHTEYPDNHLRVLSVWRSGLVQLVEISLISQGGNFFLTVQPTYTVGCYQFKGKVFCPFWDFKHPWKDIMAIFRPLLYPSNLPALETYQKPPEPTTPTNPNQGVVLWWNCAQGLGKILTRQGIAWAHWSEICTSRPLVHLRTGEIVTFGSLITPRMTKGRISGLTLEATDVKPLADG